jgi:hypothetical protein
MADGEKRLLRGTRFCAKRGSPAPLLKTYSLYMFRDIGNFKGAFLCQKQILRVNPENPSLNILISGFREHQRPASGQKRILSAKHCRGAFSEKRPRHILKTC